MSDMKLHSVNWQDGMLISQRHLTDQERYFEELVRWYGLFPGDNYGLVRKTAAAEALTLNLIMSGGRLRVEVIRCQALTPGGHYIEINDSSRNAVSAEIDAGQMSVPVFLSVDPTCKKAVGEPDPSEDVPRVPYGAGNYTLHLGSPPSLPEPDFLQIAQLKITDGEVAHDESYLPPCLTLWSDERLNQRATDLRNRLENLLSLSSRAYAAITTAGALSDESSSVQTAFKETMYQMAFHISGLLDELVVGRNGRHPITLVTQFKRLFRVYATLLNLHPGLKDYLNARFFVKEMNSEIGRFMAGVDAFLLADYNHRDLGGQVKTISDTLGTLRNIFGFLAQLKREQLGPQALATDTLTYLGKTYRVADYAACHTEEVGELTYILVNFPEPIAVSDTVVLMSKDLFSVAEWNNMQVRLGLNEARGLGETDPVDVDVVTYGDKASLHPQDMLKSPAVRQVTLIFRGARDAGKLANLGKTDLILYRE